MSSFKIIAGGIIGVIVVFAIFALTSSKGGFAKLSSYECVPPEVDYTRMKASCKIGVANCQKWCQPQGSCGCGTVEGVCSLKNLKKLVAQQQKQFCDRGITRNLPHEIPTGISRDN